jgi:ribosomal protein L37AE/L43A
MSDRESTIRDLQESWSKSDVLEHQNCPKCGQPMEYYENGEGKGFWTCQKCNFDVKKSKMASLTTPLWKKTVKFFVHGIAFSGLFFALEIVWALTGVFLILIGSLIGLIIGILLLFIIVGVANSIVSRFVWGFSMKDSATNIFFHGLILFIILLVVDLVLMVPVWIFVGNSIVIAAKFVVSCFFYGLIGKKVAEMWRE